MSKLTGDHMEEATKVVPSPFLYIWSNLPSFNPN